MPLVIAALLAAAPGSLSAVVRQEERLRFVFANKGKTSRFMISGSRPDPIPWSRQALSDVVAGCGGERLEVQVNNPYRMTIDARSGADNLRVAQCVKAAVSVRFAVGIRPERGALDESGFMSLWDRERT